MIGIPYFCDWNLGRFRTMRLISRDGFRERRALGYLSFWGSTEVWRIWPFVWKA